MTLEEENLIKSKALQYINLYAHYISSKDLDKLSILGRDWYKYMEEETKKIIDMKTFIELIKEERLNVPSFKNEYDNAKGNIIEKYNTPTINKFIAIISNYEDVEKGFNETLKDPRFISLKTEDKDELLKHIKASIKIKKWEEEFKDDAKMDYIIEASCNEDFKQLKRIQILTSLSTYKYNNKRMREHIKIHRPYATYSDKMLINELMNVNVISSKEKTTEILQEISYRIAAAKNENSTFTFLQKAGDKTSGFYDPSLHIIVLNIMALYRKNIDSKYYNLYNIVEVLKTTEHEAAHANNHVLLHRIYQEIVENDISVEEIKEKMDSRKDVFVALTSLIENVYGEIFDSEDYYSSLCDEQNSRNEEYRFLETLIKTVDDNQKFEELAAIYVLDQKSERDRDVDCHLYDMIETIEDVILSFDFSKNKHFVALNKILKATREILYEYGEAALVKKHFPYLHNTSYTNLFTKEDISKDVYSKMAELRISYLLDLASEKTK